MAVLPSCTGRWLSRRTFLAALAGQMALLAACAPAATPTPVPPSPTTAAAKAPTSATAVPAPTVVPLTGKVSRSALEAFAGWESLRAQDYTPEAAAIEKIRASSATLEVLAFVATWCPDSKREVPRLLKLMDQAGVPESKLTMIGLDRTKKDAEGLTVKWDLKYVPTFILLKEGKEVGRVIEKSQGTLDADLVQILASPAPMILSGSRPELRVTGSAAVSKPSAASEPATLSVQEVKALLEGSSKPPIFDARPKASYDAGHVSGAISLPLDQLEGRIAEVPKDRLSVFYCVGKT